MRLHLGKTLGEGASFCVNNELDVIEVNFARRLPKGKGKYKWKIQLIFFSCEEVGHIVARCPNKESKDDKIQQVQRQERFQELQRL